MIARSLACFLLAASALAAGNPAFAPDAPPIASRITLSQPDAQNEVAVTGAPGAVLANSYLMAVSLSLGYYTIARASADGSFTVSVTAPMGTTIQLKADPLGKVLPAFDESNWRTFGALPGTLLRVPEAAPPPSPSGIAFATAGRTDIQGAYFDARGSINKLAFRTGDDLTIAATVVVRSAALDATSRPTLRFAVALARVTTPEGTEMAVHNTFGSTFLTPTNLPIERRPACGRTVFKDDFPAAMTSSTGRAEVTRSVSIALPSHLLPGYYQPYLMLFFQGIPAAAAEPRVVGTGGLPNHWLSINAPLIRVGEPAAPRLAAILFADTWSHGTRGIRAREDLGVYGLAAQVATQSDVLVLPRGRYRVEPHIPTLGISDRGTPMPEPRIALRFPSGGLTVRLSRPDGTSSTIGPSAIAQIRTIAPAKENGESFDQGSHHPGDIYQLSTMDPRFEVNFEQYGRYRITLDGNVEDLWGGNWRIAGTYDVIIAEAMVLDTAVLPGTPFEVGDRPSFSITTIPPLPAEIEASFRLAPQSDASRMRETIARGRANRFGVFLIPGFVAGEAGEYRMDIVATHVDARGVWWAGTRTWGGVVAPKDSNILVHGRRGVFFQELPRQPWFFESQVGTLRFDSHATFPFFSGDVMWHNANGAMLVAVNQQDASGEIDTLMASRCPTLPDALPGETPLMSSRADKLDPHFDLGAVDLWSYAYASVQRPLIRVRELIGDGIEGHQFGYWQFREHYGAQPGVANGDRPNDIKFLFGGAVNRGSALKRAQYGIYGALFVALPYADDGGGGTRVFPPFQGNGDGPSGGPIMTLKGKPIDIFFHPTSVRPGTILERDALASFAGYAAPTLPAKIEISVTSPSGKRSTVAGQASAIGYFSDPSLPGLSIDESGVWRAKVKIFFDGVLPSTQGQVRAPYPTGDVPGSREGEFYFYAVDRRDEPLDVRVDMGKQDGVTGPVTFDVVPPSGLRDGELFYTTMMPGVVLEEGSTRALRYVYDAHQLSQQFPNLDFELGRAYFDTITVSLVLSGTDAGGVRRHFARQIILQGEELQMPEQKPVPPQPRRRAVKR